MVDAAYDIRPTVSRPHSPPAVRRSALANAYTAEICAGAGFDWLLLAGEHAPNDPSSVLAQLQAIAACPDSHAIARIPMGHGHVGEMLIKQYLDLGVQTLLVPMVDTREQAAAIDGRRRDGVAASDDDAVERRGAGGRRCRTAGVCDHRPAVAGESNASRAAAVRPPAAAAARHASSDAPVRLAC